MKNFSTIPALTSSLYMKTISVYNNALSSAALLQSTKKIEQDRNGVKKFNHANTFLLKKNVVTFVKKT